ncbi:MAG: D-aminoacyl-tRNA deacylase [Nanoarchaeota archaeon]
MFQKYLIIASKQDTAGINITTQLSQFGNFNFYLMNGETVYTENIDMDKIKRFDFIIFASKHQSKEQKKTLSIHAPGNWRSADFGGEPGKICVSSAQFQKQLFQKLNENAKKFNLKNYEITLECTHHGPLVDKPCVYIEIGSTANEWRDRKSAFIIAKTISDTIREFKENPYNEIAVGIGGPHYCPSFNKIQLNSNVALSHIIPLYKLPLNEEMIHEALNKTVEEVDLVLLDWKGLGNSEQRKQVTDVLDKNPIRYKRTSNINK